MGSRDLCLISPVASVVLREEREKERDGEGTKEGKIERERWGRRQERETDSLSPLMRPWMLVCLTQRRCEAVPENTIYILIPWATYCLLCAYRNTGKP